MSAHLSWQHLVTSPSTWCIYRLLRLLVMFRLILQVLSASQTGKIAGRMQHHLDWYITGGLCTSSPSLCCKAALELAVAAYTIGILSQKERNFFFRRGASFWLWSVIWAGMCHMSFHGTCPTLDKVWQESTPGVSHHGSHHTPSDDNAAPTSFHSILHAGPNSKHALSLSMPPKLDCMWPFGAPPQWGASC